MSFLRTSWRVPPGYTRGGCIQEQPCASSSTHSLVELLQSIGAAVVGHASVLLVWVHQCCPIACDVFQKGMERGVGRWGTRHSRQVEPQRGHWPDKFLLYDRLRSSFAELASADLPSTSHNCYAVLHCTCLESTCGTIALHVIFNDMCYNKGFVLDNLFCRTSGLLSVVGAPDKSLKALYMYCCKARPAASSASVCRICTTHKTIKVHK